MIRPITTVNFNSPYRPSFKGFYDPTTPNIPAGLRENLQPAKNIFEKLGDEISESKEKLEVVISKVMEKRDGNNIINESNNTLLHFTPDGSPHIMELKDSVSDPLTEINNEILNNQVMKGTDIVLNSGSGQDAVFKHLFKDSLYDNTAETVVGQTAETFTGGLSGGDILEKIPSDDGEIIGNAVDKIIDTITNIL